MSYTTCRECEAHASWCDHPDEHTHVQWCPEGGRCNYGCPPAECRRERIRREAGRS